MYMYLSHNVPQPLLPLIHRLLIAPVMEIVLYCIVLYLCLLGAVWYCQNTSIILQLTRI